MSEVTKLLSVRRHFGKTKKPFLIDVLKTTEAKKQAFRLIWKQVHSNPIISALKILADPESKDAFKYWVRQYLRHNIAIGCYSHSNKLVAVDVLNRQEFCASSLHQDEFKGVAYGNFITYLNIIHEHVQANYQKIDQNKYYLTSLGVFTKPRYHNSTKIQREMIFTRKLVARVLCIGVIATPFIGKKMQGIAESYKYKGLKVLSCEEMLQLGLKELIIREEFPIKIMRLKVTIKQEINTPIIRKRQDRKNEVAGAVKKLRKVHFTNIRGLKSNIKPVRHHLETEKPHLLFLTDSMIAPPSDVAHLNSQGYLLEHNFKRHAGVCVYVRKGLYCQRLRRYEDARFSTLWLLLDSGLHKTIYVCLYRSHSCGQATTRLFDHLQKSTELAKQEYPSAEFVFLGDFNALHREWLFPNKKTNRAGREAHQLAKSLELHQVVDFPTHVPDVDGETANCLDLLLTTNPERHSVSVVAPLGSSDHNLVKSKSCYCPPDFSHRATSPRGDVAGIRLRIRMFGDVAVIVPNGESGLKYKIQGENYK